MLAHLIGLSLAQGLPYFVVFQLPPTCHAQSHDPFGIWAAIDWLVSERIAWDSRHLVTVASLKPCPGWVQSISLGLIVFAML